MIYEITVSGQTHFKEFDGKRQAKAWAIEQAGIAVRTARPDALYRHLHNHQPQEQHKQEDTGQPDEIQPLKVAQ